MRNHTTFYFVSTCDLQMLMKNKMHESLHVGMFVKRRPMATMCCTVRSTWQKNTARGGRGRNTLAKRDINNGVLWPYAVVDLMNHQNEIMCCGFQWDLCGYPRTICRIFSALMFGSMCNQAQKKKVAFYRPERTEGRFICCDVLINAPVFLGCWIWIRDVSTWNNV